MSTLKRQKSDGSWEYVQLAGLDVVKLQNDLNNHIATDHPLTNNKVAKTATVDWNNYKETGFYMGQNLANAPATKSGDSPWWYVQVIQHNSLWCVQTAWNFNNGRAMSRVLNNNVWTQWKNADGGGGTVRSYTVEPGKTVTKGMMVSANSKGEISHPVNQLPFADFPVYTTGQTILNNGSGSLYGRVSLTDEISVLNYRVTNSNGTTTQFASGAIRVSHDGEITEGAFLSQANMSGADIINGNNYLSTARIDDNRFLYITILNGSYYAEIGVGTVNHSTLGVTLSHKQNVYAGNANVDVQAVSLGNGRVFIVYRGASNAMKCRVVTWNGSSLTLGTEYNYLSNSQAKLALIDTDKLLAGYNGFACIITTTNNVVTLATPSSIPSNPSSYPTVYAISKTRAVLDIASQAILVRINADNSITELSKISKLSYVASQIDSNSFLSTWNNSVQGYYYDENKDNLFVSSSYNFGDFGIAIQPERQDLGMWRSGDKLIIFKWISTYTTGYNVGYFRGDTGNLLGVATETKSGGQTCDVIVDGIVDGLTGIEAGAHYVSRNGILTKSWLGSPQKVAKGISSTELLLQ